jgi:hypothetical protein
MMKGSLESEHDTGQKYVPGRGSRGIIFFWLLLFPGKWSGCSSVWELKRRRGQKKRLQIKKIRMSPEKEKKGR